MKVKMMKIQLWMCETGLSTLRISSADQDECPSDDEYDLGLKPSVGMKNTFLILEYTYMYTNKQTYSAYDVKVINI